MKGNTEPPVPWPKTDGEKERQEDWRAYCDRRFQECQQHAVALEYLLNKYPEQRTWLEKHGFNTAELIDSLKWYPTEELEKLDAATAKAAARNVQREQLRKSSAQNYDRMQENLLRLLPVSIRLRCCFFCRNANERARSQRVCSYQLVREVQEELESVAAVQAAPALSRTSEHARHLRAIDVGY
ncbi:hypothetical protein EIP86_006486 [Pleurotus ostreatoroseus]|nr:hypothetical protein EIP86_006486 [Pleurotus ostreatoroseus]